jgi:hypothetical protein
MVWSQVRRAIFPTTQTGGWCLSVIVVPDRTGTYPSVEVSLINSHGL